jgi:hypothetical protein
MQTLSGVLAERRGEVSGNFDYTTIPEDAEDAEGEDGDGDNDDVHVTEDRKKNASSIDKSPDLVSDLPVLSEPKDRMPDMRL